MTLLDARGNSIILGRGKIRRGLSKVARRFKSLGKRETLVGITAGMGALAITGNPYVAAIGGTAAHDIIYAQKHGKDISETLKTKTPKIAATIAANKRAS